MWWFYVLRCADDSLYAGITTDVVRRVAEHNGRGRRGAKYTRSRRPVVLLRTWACPDRSSASKLEARFKRLSRSEKLHFIANYE